LHRDEQDHDVGADEQQGRGEELTHGADFRTGMGCRSEAAGNAAAKVGAETTQTAQSSAFVYIRAACGLMASVIGDPLTVSAARFALAALALQLANATALGTVTRPRLLGRRGKTVRHRLTLGVPGDVVAGWTRLSRL